MVRWDYPTQVVWNSAWLIVTVVAVVQMVRTPKSSFIEAGVRRWMLLPFVFVGLWYRGYALVVLPLAWWLWMQPGIRRARRAKVGSPSS
jgi:hypothetical protein